ncbi:MAG TPA: BACON domain-containing carbohydrate-binding protein [Bryobacteraceae bacterium]|nr:BACON domain-containing carbohydrate-binding protein [Bryobacteraceae bacterium]
MTLRLGSFSAIAGCLFVAGGTLLAHDPHDPMQVVAISPNFAQDHTMLAASAGLTVKLGAIVMFKSTDGGADWSPVPGLLGNTTIKSVIFSPAYGQDQTVFVAGGTGLSVSKDGANTWTLLSTIPLANLALSPNFAADNTLFALGISNKVYRSLNRGVKLTPITAPSPLTSGLSTTAVSPHFASDHSLLIGSQANGIFKSFDSGATWTAVTTGFTLPNVTALDYAPDFSSSQTVFAGTHGGGFLISADGGNTWAKSNTGLTDTNVISLAFSPTYVQDGTLWVTTAAKGVFQSTNRGVSWGRPVTVSRQLSNLTTVHYQTIAATAGMQLLGMFEGLWTSVNNGASWQYVDTIPTRMVRYIHPSPNYANDQTVYASTYGSGNLWSTDGGATWAAMNTGMSAPYVDGSAISPNFEKDRMAFDGTHVGLDRTSNGGASWKLTFGIGVAAYPRGLAVSPNFINDKTVFIGTTSASGHNGPVPNNQNVTPGLYISTDQGKTWTLSSLSGIGVVSIAFSPAFATDRTAFAATQSNGIYETNDGGLTWTTLTISGVTSMAQVAVSPAFARDGVMLASTTNGGIYKSGNGGATWTKLANTGNVRALDMQFSPNYAADQTLFIGTIQNGLMVSTNGGATLTPSSFPDVFASAVGVSPNFTNDGTVFAAGYHGLFKSTDGGSTWTYLPSPARIEESRCITSTLQEPPTIVYHGAWQLVTSAPASTNEYALTTEAQDTALLSFNGSGVRWISWTGPAQGSASISLDGVTLGNVSLTGSTDLLQQAVWEQHGLACGNHTFTITAPMVSQSVTLDAFDVWIDQCPFTSNNGASLGTTSMSTSNAAGNDSVSLTATGTWTAASDAPWMSIAPGSGSGSGNALIQFSFDANTSGSPRIGTLTIAGLTFMVSQSN